MYEIIFFIHHFLFQKKKTHFSNSLWITTCRISGSIESHFIRSGLRADVSAELVLDFPESQSYFRKHTQNFMPI
ncbi:MAG: hypothetical protein CMM15_13515 [Rhodospirillaceae bacterium]|nr:hypothetical protein [Rhodospirillaceae bacterium]